MRTRQQLAHVRFHSAHHSRPKVQDFVFVSRVLQVNAQLQILSREQRRADLTFQGGLTLSVVFVIVLAVSGFLYI